MTSRAARLAILLGAVLALAACGGGEVTKQEYGQQLRSTMDDLEAAYGQAGAAIGPGGGEGGEPRRVADVVADLRAAQIALRDAGNRLDGIEPPDDLVDTHQDLVAGVRDMADAVDLLVEAQEQADRDPARAEQLAREFATDRSFSRVQAAAAELAEAGVDAGL